MAGQKAKKVTQLKAFLQVGVSFSQISIFDEEQSKKNQNAEPVRFDLLYLPQEALSASLRKIWQEVGVPERLIVTSRFMEKILDAKLGGTVAQVVTAGFETWPILRQPVLPDYFDLKPHRQAPLASKDLVFGLSERVGADGKVLKALDMSELEFINSKLKLMGVKRVCVNLLFSQIYPEHQKRVADFFRQQDFEVFAFERHNESCDEMPAWRKNVINACLSGVFSEHAEEILRSFDGQPVDLQFLDHRGQLFFADKNQIAGSLFSWLEILKGDFENEADEILHLGLETWTLLSTRERSLHWESSWGRIEVDTPKMIRLKTQPTLEISPGAWGGLHLSTEELSYEPGPMCFGRAQKPMVIDVLNETFNLKLKPIQPQGIRRLQDQLTALAKNIPELSDHNFQSLSQALCQQIAQRIAMEAHFHQMHYKKSRKTVLTGHLAPELFPILKKIWASGELLLDPRSKDRLSLALKNHTERIL